MFITGNHIFVTLCFQDRLQAQSIFNGNKQSNEESLSKAFLY